MMQQVLYNHVSSRRLRSQAEITRTRIESIIESQPGIRFRELVRMTKLAHGTLSHNIKILERQRRIRIRRDRGSTHIFPKSYDDKLCVAIVYTRHPTTMAIIALLLANDCNCHQIKKAVMRSSSTVCEHLKRLSLADLVSRRRMANRLWVYSITDIEMAVMIMNRRTSNNW
jgi:predicted transcriptional regulator